MNRKELIEKKVELEGRITTLNEKLRFGSSGDTAGIEAISKMKENLKLVNVALVNMPSVEVVEPVVEPIIEPVVEPIIEPAPEGVEAQLGTGD